MLPDDKGVLRVVWTKKNHKSQKFEKIPLLNLTRALGDFWSGSNHESSIVSPVPYVTSFTLTDDIQYFILATDGLWDVFSPVEVIEFVRQKINGKAIGLFKKDYNICMELVYAALKKSSSDNISITLVTIDHITDTEVTCISDSKELRKVPDTTAVMYVKRLNINVIKFQL